jgi:hypothetical protein
MTDTLIRWDPLFPVTLSVVVALVVLIVLIAVEFRRRLKYRTIRIVCQCLLVIAVLLLSLRPSVSSQSKGSGILLITDGTTEAMVDSIKRTDPSLVTVDTKDLASLNELSNMHVSVIAGNGLPSWAIDLLPEKSYRFIPSEITDGISAIDLPGHVYAHRWNDITGTYDLANPSATLKLRGPGGVEDSVELKGPGTIPFSLSYFSKAPGRFNYDLITPTGTETLPVVIEPERQFNILFIADYPTFEVRYLKNFLASKGHRLSIRNQVSRGRYKLEFANRPSMTFQSLSTAVLNDADLLVIDEPSWHTLGSAEQKNLRAAIQDGLGVIVIPQSQRNKNRSQLIQLTPTAQKDTVRVSLDRAGSFLLPALPFEVKPSTAVVTANDRVLSGFSHSGAGKIGYQLLYETYQTGLQGKADAYSAIWVPLLEKCARNEQQDFKIKITSPFPFYENQPIGFDVVSSGKEPHVQTENTDVPLSEDAYIDDLWHGKIWLEGSSWHQLRVDSISTWIHLAQKNSWTTLNSGNTREATALSASMGSTEVASQITYSDRPIKVALFILFILSSGFLWLAPKLS